MPSATFYVVRHAHAVWQPDEQQRLSAQGRRDAERVANLLHTFPVAAVYASPYPRAAETVEPLARRLGHPVRIEDGLHERRLSAGCVPDFERAVRRAWEHPDDALPGGEPNRVARERVLAVVERLRARHPNEHLALGTHGSLMALLLHHFDPRFGFADWERMSMPDVYRLGPEGTVNRLWGEG